LVINYKRLNRNVYLNYSINDDLFVKKLHLMIDLEIQVVRDEYCTLVELGGIPQIDKRNLFLDRTDGVGRGDRQGDYGSAELRFIDANTADVLRLIFVSHQLIQSRQHSIAGFAYGFTGYFKVV
jgi:hypothetical protein